LRLAGGSMSIRTAIGAGTIVEVRAPLGAVTAEREGGTAP
jgi:hypothetical protein